jgi:hypothetical protein
MAEEWYWFRLTHENQHNDRLKSTAKGLEQYGFASFQ